MVENETENSKIYPELNKAWKSTCRILFGEELGELKEYEEWLSEYLPNIGKGRSCVSGKEVILAMDNYPTSANFVSADEIKETSAPLNINDIKDIDSISRAVSERWEYAGNRALGKSTNIELSDFIVDSHYVYKGVDVIGSEYAYMSSNTQGSKYVFGCRGFFFGEFGIAFVKGTRMKRIVGSQLGFVCSDTYFSANTTSCHDIMFSFNQTSKRNMIGNLELQKETYLSLKKKLIGEIAEEIRKNKRFPSVIELANGKRSDRILKVELSSLKKNQDMDPIEKAFSSTSKVIFKKELTGIARYEDWLSRDVSVPRELESQFGSTALFSALVAPMDSLILSKGIISIEEAEELGKTHLNPPDLTSVSRIREKLTSIAYLTTEIIAGNNSNVIKCPVMFGDINVYRVDRALNSESSGVGYLISNSRFIFGSNKVSVSQSCMKCYYSTRLTRCFEVDTSTDCSDAYFCHNNEGLNEAMFCWNLKGKRYVIGNAQLTVGQYREIKESMLDQISSELEAKKELKWNIFNIACSSNNNDI